MRRIMCFTAAAGALFLIVSCASAPPQVDSAPPAPPPEQPKPQPQATQPEKPAVPAPDAELAQAKGLQQRVDALGLGTYAPEDYAAANKDLQAGQDAYGKDNAASKTSLQAAISGYNAVLSKGGPLFLAWSQEQTEASKKAADDLKASVAVKDDYEKADGTYRQALQEKDAGDIENANRDFGLARDDFDDVAKTAQQKKDAALQALQTAQSDRTASEQKAQDAQKALKDEGF
jgi:hypothetical protein